MHSQRITIAILSLTLNGWIAQCEITEFYFSENSWRNHLDNSRGIGTGIGTQQITHLSAPSEKGGLVLEELKNAEYLSPLPNLTEIHADGAYFVVEEFFPLRSMKATRHAHTATKAYSRYDTKNFITHINSDDRVVLTVNPGQKSGESASIVVLTYLDDIKKNAVALVVADTDAIRHSAADGLFFGQTEIPIAENTTNINAAAFLSREANLQVLVFVLFFCFSLLALLKTGKMRKIRTELAANSQPLTVPKSTAFLENKVLLELVSSPKIRINKFSKTEGFQLQNSLF